MKKTVFLVADPKISRGSFNDGMHDSGGLRAYRNEPAPLKIGNAAKRRDPNSPLAILKKGLHDIIRQSTLDYLPRRPCLS